MNFVFQFKRRISCAISLSVLLHIGFLLFAMHGIVNLQTANPSRAIGALLDLRPALTSGQTQPQEKIVKDGVTKTAIKKSPTAVPTALPQSKDAKPKPNRSLATTDLSAEEQLFSSGTTKDRDAIFQWHDKLLLIGQTNTPTDLEGVPLKGEVKIRLTIRADGSLISAELIGESGQPLLDDAALNLVRMASPFARADGRNELSLHESSKIYVYETTWAFPGPDSQHN